MPTRIIRLSTFLVLGLIFASATTALAGNVRMWVEPELISLLDRAVLKIEFKDAKGDAADIPAVDGLKIDYRGPSTQYSLINGKSSSTVTHTYLITPTKVGDYTIGPVRVKFNGGDKVFTSKLRVIKPQDDQEAQKISEILFSRIITDRSSPYVNEPFQLELRVYVRDGVQIDGNFGITGGLPESGLDGELEWEAAGRTREELNGIIFNVYTLHGTVKALTAGTFIFSPEVELHVVIPRQQRRSWGFDDPFFGDFFGRQETRPIVLDCNELNIDVKPIPMAGRPASYTGGVGVMNFMASVGPTKLKAGDPVTVKMRITGEGNLEKITPPTIKEQPGIKQYEARSVPTDRPNEVLFEQVIIPTSDEIKEIPAIGFSYFNTQTADFRTVTQGPFPIIVEAAPQGAQVMNTLPVASMQETRVLGHDIAYLKPAPGHWKKEDAPDLQQSVWFKVLWIAPALFLCVTGMAVGKRSRLEGDEALARRQKAPRAARQHLHRADQAIRQADAAAFYEAMWNALTDYFGHRFNLAPGQVTLQTVRDRIPEEADAIERLFNLIEQRRYGIQPSEAELQEEMRGLHRQLTAILKKCERMKR